MPAVVFPRRALSTPTTIAVNSVGLPSWLPAAGSWSTPSNPVSGAKPASLNTATSIKGSFAGPMTSSRAWDPPNGLWDDWMGGVWNPHIGTYGAMIVMGGGHATSYGMADNGVYAWFADDRRWRRLVDLTYPGEIPLADWDLAVQAPYTSDLLNSYGELATNVPVATHTRWLPCILPPSVGGGSQGDFVLPVSPAGHIAANGPAIDAIGNQQGHRLNCATAISVGSAAASSAWSRMGGYAPFTNGKGLFSATVDTNVSRGGRVYVSTHSLSYKLAYYSIASNTWVTVTPSGFVSDNIAGGPIQYAAAHDMLIIFCGDGTLRLLNAASMSLGMAMVNPTITGTPPSGVLPDIPAGNGGGFVWCPDLPPYGAVVHYNPVNFQVKACFAPSNPLSGGTWNWQTLAASNTPTGHGSLTANNWFNRFQYAPALKSFFLASTPSDSFGGLACFRPVEIP